MGEGGGQFKRSTLAEGNSKRAWNAESAKETRRSTRSQARGIAKQATGDRFPDQPAHPRTPPFGTSQSKKKGDYTATLPPAAYLALSDPRHLNGSSSSAMVPKLLVLDLNGALLYRHKSGTNKIHPRPYMGNFLEYLFGLHPNAPFAIEGGGVRASKAYQVFVWSSAQPHNVRRMVEASFGPRWIEGVYAPEDPDIKFQREQAGEGRLLGVWARDMMDLDKADYGTSPVDITARHLAYS
jgi:hypothetical protein